MPYRTFNLNEAATYLHLACADLETMVQHREIPVETQGNRLVFRKKDIDAWVSRRILGVSHKWLANYHKKTSALARDWSNQTLIVTALTQPEGIEPALTSKTKSSVIRDMVALADRTGKLSDPRDFLQSLVEREKLCSTALSDGIALLHPRNHDQYMVTDSFISIGRVIHPVPFGAPDGKRTNLFFLIGCRDIRQHLHVLARLCMLAKQVDFLHQLRAAPSANAMIAVLHQAEEEVVAQV